MAIVITKVWGIGAQTADVLAEHGFKTAEDLAQTSVLSLVNVPGFGPAKAQKVIESALALLEANVQEETPKVSTQDQEKSVKKDKKKKKKKKKKSKKVKKKKKEQKQKKNLKDIKKKKGSSKKKK